MPKSYTKFTNLEAGEFKGDVNGTLNGLTLNKVSIEKAADYTLSAAEAKCLCVGATLTAASKAVTLGIKDGQIMFVVNEGGTNAFTVKPVAGDSGTSLAAGKVALVVGATGANASKVYVLN